MLPSNNRRCRSMMLSVWLVVLLVLMVQMHKSFNAHLGETETIMGMTWVAWRVPLAAGVLAAGLWSLFISMGLVMMSLVAWWQDDRRSCREVLGRAGVALALGCCLLAALAISMMSLVFPWAYVQRMCLGNEWWSYGYSVATDELLRARGFSSIASCLPWFNAPALSERAGAVVFGMAGLIAGAWWFPRRGMVWRAAAYAGAALAGLMAGVVAMDWIVPLQNDVRGVWVPGLLICYALVAAAGMGAFLGKGGGRVALWMALTIWVQLLIVAGSYLWLQGGCEFIFYDIRLRGDWWMLWVGCAVVLSVISIAVLWSGVRRRKNLLRGLGLCAIAVSWVEMYGLAAPAIGVNSPWDGASALVALGLFAAVFASVAVGGWKSSE